MQITPSEQELRDMLKEGKTLYQISRSFDTTIPEIFKLGRSYGISFAYDHNHIPRPTKQDIESMYNDEYMTQKQISIEFNVSRGTIYNLIRKFKIPTRGGSGTLSVPTPPREVLERMCIEDGMTRKQIASEFVVSRSKVHNWFKKHNIKIGARSGEKHYNWKGGITKDPYCELFTEELKEYIRDKHGRRCFLCNKTEEENVTKLPVHHTDYNKDCGCDGTQCVLVPLCIGCNVKVNYNRSYWESLIKKKLKSFEMSCMMKHPLFDFAGTPEQPIKLFNLSTGKEIIPTKTPKYTKEGMIQYLKTVTQKLGHVPCRSDITKISKSGNGPSAYNISKYIAGNVNRFTESLEIAGLFD